MQGLGVWEQPGDVTEVAPHAKVRVMGSHAPGNTAGREGEREGGGEEAPSPMDSAAHLAGGSWCCSLLQRLCQRQDTGLAAAISSSKCQLPCLSARDGCAAMGTLACAPPGAVAPCPVPAGWQSHLVPLLALGGHPQSQGSAGTSHCCWGGLAPSCTPGSEAHAAWGAVGVPHSPDVLRAFTRSSAQTQLCPEVQPHSSPSS